MFQLKRVESKSDWRDFIDLAWDIYEGDTVWVPPLKIAVRDLLDVRKNPFFKHASMQMWVAYRDGKRVGRIVACVDDTHNRFHGEKTGFFGFYEAIDDQKLANALFEEAATWLRGKGMTTMRGPMNPSTNHECSLLIEGFDNPPSVMMTYNPPYYVKHFDTWGLTKAKDLFAYEINGLTGKFSERMMAQAERLKKRGSVTFRKINMNDFEGEVRTILDIYNDAWEDNWGFVPMNEEEFRHLAKDMKMIIDPAMVLVAMVRGEIAGFGLTLPDVNQVFNTVRDGQLFPTGIFKLLWNLKGPGRKKTINRCRIVTLGIKKAYRNFAIGPLLYAEYMKLAPENGYPIGEASWILEDNGPMNKALEHMGATKTKTYRIYDKAL